MTVDTLPVGELAANCYLVADTEGRALIIDPGDEAGRITEEIHRRGLTPVAIVLTHAHFDHMMAMNEIAELFGIPVWVGVGDGDAMTDPHLNLSALFTPGRLTGRAADRLLREGDTVTAGDVNLTVWETPGHTPGSICLIGDGVLISGDTLFADTMGRSDFPGGSARKLIASLRRLATLPTELVVYPGHGDSTTIEQALRENPYFGR